MVTRTHCRNGHDLSLPGAIRVVRQQSRLECEACYKDRQAQRAAAVGGKPRHKNKVWTECARCGCAKPPSCAAYCSDRCRNQRPKGAKPRGLDEMVATRREFELSDLIERETRPWVRAELIEERDRLRGARGDE